MKNILFTCAFLFSVMLFAQKHGGIKGTVTDQALNGEPLLLAHVQVKGSDTSYQTNFHGNFEIPDVEPGEYTVAISYAGYDTEELNVIVKENRISMIETDLAPLQISFDNVLGTDTAAKEEAATLSKKEVSHKE